MPLMSALPPPLTLGFTRNMKEAAPCGSRSQSTVRSPLSAARKARLTAVVVFPTPPLML